jgi:large subunit ribosomal protein L15
MKQNTIKSAPGSRKTRKRVGRGGQKGTYAGRGMNGQNSRSGGGVRVGFEGGQTPLLQRMPKMKGFKNPSRVNYFGLNVKLVDARYEDGENVDAASLVKKGILKKLMPIKLLGYGEITKKVIINVHLASKGAIEKVEKAGGKVELIGKISAKEAHGVKGNKKAKK